MSSGEIFVTFVIPAVTIAIAYAAMRANEWAIQRDERKSGK
jgi:predicted transcriptional regulator